MPYQEPWNGQNRLEITIMFPGIAMCCLKQHKMRISGMGAQYKFHLRGLSAAVQLKQQMSSLRKNSCHTYSSFPLRIHPLYIPSFYSFTTVPCAVILIIYIQVLIQQSTKAWRHDLPCLVWCSNHIPFLFSWFEVFPTWEKQSSSVNCYSSNGVTTTFPINCGFSNIGL